MRKLNKEKKSQSLRQKEDIIRNKLVAALFTVFAGFVIAACSPAAGTQPAEPGVEEAQENQEQTGISVAQAEAIAVSMVEDGIFRRLEVREEDGVQVYNITVEAGEDTHEVILNAQTGALISRELLDTAAASEGSTDENTEENEGSTNTQSDNATSNDQGSSSSPSASNGGSSSSGNAGSSNNGSGNSSGSNSGSISRNRAIDLSRAHLESIGISNARLNYAYQDTENGTPVWSVEFSAGGRDLEFYVNRNTGAFLKAPSGGSNSGSSNSGSSSDSGSSSSSSGSSSNGGSGNSSSNDSGSISRDRARQIALGVVNGSVIEVDTDTERGRAVWYVAIRSGGRIHEIYVDRSTGAIVLHESEIDD